MIDLYRARLQKTCRKRTAKQLIDDAVVIKTMSNHYYIRCDDLDLQLTGYYQLSVNDDLTCLCVMDIDDDYISKMESLQAEIEQLYLDGQG